MEKEKEKEKFEAYEHVRASGLINMFDTKHLIMLADRLCDVVLTKKDIKEIMKNFNLLKNKYGE